MFFGRKKELSKLLELKEKSTASLVVIKGRRRIGKSSLIDEFSKNFESYCPIQGIAPQQDILDVNQRTNFSEQVSNALQVPALTLNNWTDAFLHLASHTKTGKTLILLDEISWMGSSEPDFVGKLKIAWDNSFKKNPNLILVLCGSVSSWIDKNILKDADFVGRISLEIDLQELPLRDCNQFWLQQKDLVSSMEKCKLLCTTGGIPKYLEEINPKLSAEKNIKKLFFDKGAILLKEYDKIFNQIFNTRSKQYRKIIEILSSKKCNAKEISTAMGKTLNGDISEYLSDLEASGFIKNEYSWKFDGKKSRISKYRLKDNYLRFYLKYVEPIKEKIQEGLYEYKSLEHLTHWHTIMGFQFENLVLHNLSDIIKLLDIDFNSIVSASPYYQNSRKDNKGACQIDLLIQTTYSTLYVCEIKFRKNITSKVISDVKRKIEVLKRPKTLTIRPVLIYMGELDDKIIKEDYFVKKISFGDLLTLS